MGAPVASAVRETPGKPLRRQGSAPALVRMSLEYTLPAAPPPAESSVTVRFAALHGAGPAGAGADDGGVLLGAWLVAGAEEPDGLLEVDAGSGVPWDWGWLGPHAVSRRVAAATAVVMTRPFLIG
jgi:hypothetical protein